MLKYVIVDISNILNSSSYFRESFIIVHYCKFSNKLIVISFVTLDISNIHHSHDERVKPTLSQSFNQEIKKIVVYLLSH